MKVVLLNVKYSPNLGDGIIAECFEHALRAAVPRLDVSSCDLAGRTDFQSRNPGLRSLVLGVMGMLPSSLRSPALASLVRYQLKSHALDHYRWHLRDADIAVIGGGQLIADAGLNFPLKISSAVEIARQNGARVAIFGAGVGQHVSGKGKALFRAAFDPGLEAVGLRDELSLERWNAMFDTPRASLVHDPGMLASDLYPAEKRRADRVKPRVGLGITDPNILRLHADTGEGAHDTDWISRYADLACTLTGEGFAVSLFTNGATNDQSCAAKVYRRIQSRLADAGDVSLRARPERPDQLASMIAGFDAVIAHRLHANIVAFSYGVPHIGLHWDSKMTGFFDGKGRSRYLIGCDTLSQEEKIVPLLRSALSEGISPFQLAVAKRSTREAIVRFANALLGDEHGAQARAG